MKPDSNPVYLETQGQGQDVVLVHGWGMHGGFWREFAEELAREYRVTCVDLPGHGRSAPIDDYAPETIATLLARSAPGAAHWIGWSLGATLALFLAGLFPERVKSVGLLAGNPKFSRDPDWRQAITREVLDQFKHDLIGDCHRALLRFLNMQTFGMESSRETYRTLKTRLNECAPPDPEALCAGVEILKHADQRERLRTLNRPVLAILGTADSLVPACVSRSLLELNPMIDCCVIQGAGHIPFITHRRECLAEVLRFLKKQGLDSDA